MYVRDASLRLQNSNFFENESHLVELAAGGDLEGGGGGGVFDSHELGHNALDGRAVKAAVRILVLEVHACTQ